jgi:hypothetical protein
MASTTPEAAIAAYVDGWNRRDASEVKSMLVGADVAGRSGSPIDTTLQFNITSTDVLGKTAIVHLDLMVHNQVSGQNISIRDKVDLLKVGNSWKLLSIPASDPAGYVHVLQWFGSSTFENTELLSGDEIDSSAGDTTLWNVRHLASALLRYRAANGGRFMAPGSNVHELLSTFLGNPRFWDGPRPGYSGFSVNDRLLGLAEGVIRDPDHTVLVYEGSGGKLVHPKGRPAAVGFANGRVQLVNANQESSLKWTP